MSHWIILPVLLPLFSGAGLLLLERWRPAWVGPASVSSGLLLLLVSLRLFAEAGAGEVGVYLLGNWEVPFGIVLVADRLAALMVLLTAVVGLASIAYAAQGWDRRGAHFHALLQLQLMGLNGAFLTGDLFNLFVFFEVLLAASYGLLLHAGGGERMRAAFHVIAINLTGSALFLISVSLLYGLTGTLLMADMAQRLAELGAGDAGLARGAGMLLMVVFFIKAAVIPLNFWLPSAYAAASGPSAALFAILTKVGVYAVLRVSSLMFGPQAGPVADLAAPVLLPVALATVAVASLGALAAGTLGRLVGYMVVVSAGTLLVGIGLSSRSGVAAALVYLVHSTLAASAFFLLVDLLRRARGDAGDRLEPSAPAARAALLGTMFFVAAVASAGLPPLSGFVGKLLILESAASAPAAPWVLGVILAAGLLTVIALARAGTRIFWKSVGQSETHTPAIPLSAAMPAGALLAGGVLVSVLAGPLRDYTGATADQLASPQATIERVMSARPVGSEKAP